MAKSEIAISLILSFYLILSLKTHEVAESFPKDTRKSWWCCRHRWHSVIRKKNLSVSQMFDKQHTLNCLQRLPWWFQQPLIRWESFTVQHVHISGLVCLWSLGFDLFSLPSHACMHLCVCVCVCVATRSCHGVSWSKREFDPVENAPLTTCDVTFCNVSKF